MFQNVFQIGLFIIVALSSLALIAPGIPRADIALVVDLVGEVTKDFFFYSSDAPCMPT
jgi:hypothetical protein